MQRLECWTIQKIVLVQANRSTKNFVESVFTWHVYRSTMTFYLCFTNLIVSNVSGTLVVVFNLNCYLWFTVNICFIG